MKIKFFLGILSREDKLQINIIFFHYQLLGSSPKTSKAVIRILHCTEDVVIQ